MTLLPPINTHVELRDHGGRVFVSRVESVDDGLVTVARPSDFPVTETFEHGYKLDVLWPTENGVHTLPTKVATVTRDGLLPVWVLEPLGDTLREQRRNFVRLSLGIPMTLSRVEGEDHDPIKCVLADVSEAALRCQMRKRDDIELDANTVVRAGFTIDQTAFALTGTVLRWRYVPAAEDPKLDDIEVIMMFDIDEQIASQLRRAVFAEQIRIRNLSPGD